NRRIAPALLRTSLFFFPARRLWRFAVICNSQLSRRAEPLGPLGFSFVTDIPRPPSTIESMIRVLEQLIAAIWNRLATRRRGARFQGGSLDLGFRIVDGRATRSRVTLTSRERMRHVVVLGKTGSGKSYLLRYMSEQDIAKDRGFISLDL